MPISSDPPFHDPLMHPPPGLSLDKKGSTQKKRHSATKLEKQHLEQVSQDKELPRIFASQVGKELLGRVQNTFKTTLDAALKDKKEEEKAEIGQKVDNIFTKSTEKLEKRAQWHKKNMNDPSRKAFFRRIAFKVLTFLGIYKTEKTIVKKTLKELSTLIKKEGLQESFTKHSFVHLKASSTCRKSALDKFVDKEFSHLLAKERGTYHIKETTVESSFKIHSKKYTNRAERLNPGSYLVASTDHRIAMREKQLGGDKRKIEQDSEIRQLRAEKETYQTYAEKGVVRSSMEAQKMTDTAPEKSKRNLTVNAYTDGIQVDGEYYDFGRCGAFHDFSLKKTNIYQMQGQLKGATGDEQVKLKAACVQTARTLEDMAGAQIRDQALRLGEEIERDLESRVPNFQMEQGVFDYTRVSLLGSKSGSKEWHMSQNQLYALEQFEGKPIIYDGTDGIDEEGIHIPRKITDPRTGKSLKLITRPKIYSVDVNGSSKANQEQTIRNEAALQQTVDKAEKYMEWLEEKGPHLKAKKGISPGTRLTEIEILLNRIEKGIKEEASDYEFAADIAELEKLLGARVDVNCKSAKDRTSALLNKVFTRFITKKAARGKKVPPGLKKQVERTVMKKGVGRYITKVNTGVAGLKFKLSKGPHAGLSYREAFWEGIRVSVIKS